jgi:hypothetical protein
MNYNHTQHGRWHYLLLVFALATVGGAWIARSQPPLVRILMTIAAVFAFCGLIFGSLTISDEGEYLALRFGPLPLLRKTIRYADITRVEIRPHQDHRRLGRSLLSGSRLDLQYFRSRLREADAGPESASGPMTRRG